MSHARGGAGGARGRWVVAALIAVACFFGGRLSADRPDALRPVKEKADCLAPARADLAALLLRPEAPDNPRPEAPQRRIHTPPLHLATPTDDEAAEALRHYEEEQGRDMVGLLRTRIRRSLFSLGADADPEDAVMQQSDYLEGWIEAVTRTAPTLADDLAAEIEVALCDPETPAAEALLYARLGRYMPEVTSSAGFECLLAEHTEEDVLLWETIDALRVSGLPAPPAIGAIAARATDERTLWRLEALRTGKPEIPNLEALAAAE